MEQVLEKIHRGKEGWQVDHKMLSDNIKKMKHYLLARRCLKDVLSQQQKGIPEEEQEVITDEELAAYCATDLVKSSLVTQGEALQRSKGQKGHDSLTGEQLEGVARLANTFRRQRAHAAVQDAAYWQFENGRAFNFWLHDCVCLIAIIQNLSLSVFSHSQTLLYVDAAVGEKRVK